jgi:hypothetical protein
MDSEAQDYQQIQDQEMVSDQPVLLLGRIS